MKEPIISKFIILIALKPVEKNNVRIHEGKPQKTRSVSESKLLCKMIDVNMY